MREQGATDPPTYRLGHNRQMRQLRGWRLFQETVEADNPMVDFGDKCRG